MRIAFVITGLETGGAEMMLFRLVSRLSSRFQPHVFSLSHSGEIAERMRKLGVPVESLGMNTPLPNPMGFVRLVRRLRKLRPHIVQTWLYHADLLGTLAALVAGVPQVSWNIRCSALNPDETPLTTRLIVRLLARMSRLPKIVVANSGEGRRVHEALGYRPRRWQVIPNGFDVESFRPDPEGRARIRRVLELRETDVVFGVVARYHPMKDHVNLLHAAAKLSGEWPEARYVLVGSGVTSENDKLQELLHTLGLSGKTRLLGERHDIPALMGALDCLISSSAWGEGFPNVVAEAMACGLPCIVTDVGDSAAIVGETGWVVRPGVPQALAAAMRACSELSTERRMALGRAARSRVTSEYSLDVVVKRYENLFDALDGKISPEEE